MSHRGTVLPEGAVLVHIGPYKTGTTAIQFSLHKHRHDMLGHGVLYPGSKHHRHTRPGYALMQKTPSGLTPAQAHEWDDLVEEVRSTTSRVCISTEDLASADVDTIRKLVEDLGPDRVHVLIVVRRLDKILPSAWQERVKSWNETLPYDEWLHDVLAEDPSTTSAGRRFWYNHGVASLLGRWTEALPPGQCILAVADEEDRGQLLRTFEQLLGLPPHLLSPGQHDNTSLTMDRIELVRRVNELFRDRRWEADHRRSLVYRGLVRGLRQAPPDSADVPIPPMPPWAAQRVATLSRARIAEATGSGAVLIGDPATLLPPDTDHLTQPSPRPELIGIETAARGIEAVLDAALRRERAARPSGADARQGAPSPAPPSTGAPSWVRPLRALPRRVARLLVRHRPWGAVRR